MAAVEPCLGHALTVPEPSPGDSDRAFGVMKTRPLTVPGAPPGQGPDLRHAQERRWHVRQSKVGRSEGTTPADRPLSSDSHGDDMPEESILGCEDGTEVAGQPQRR